MPKTLVVVDMQPYFKTALEPNTIIAVTHEIVTAIHQGSGIILLEYEDCGRSLAGFDRVLYNYPWKARISKVEDDGSSEVIQAIRRRQFPSDTLRICGVNTDCCVWGTVRGLLSKLPRCRVELVKAACNTLKRKQIDWRRYPRHPNLQLV